MSLLRVEVVAGKGLDRLSAATCVESFGGVLASLTKMTSAGGAMAFVREALPEDDPDSALFSLVEDWLRWVDGTSDGLVAAGVLSFQIRCLAHLGFRPNLEACGRSGRPVPEGRAAFFDPALGSVVSRAAGGGPIKVGRDAIGFVRQVLAEGAWPEAALEAMPCGQVRDLVGAFAEAQLGPRVGKVARAAVSCPAP